MLHDLWARLSAILGRGAGDADLDDELRFHLDHQVEKHVAAGLSREDARRRACLELGGVDQTKERYRDTRGLWLVEAIVEYGREIRRAARMLARSPAFTGVAALSLALGIGANSALFSLHDAILLRPLPVRDPSSVVTVTAIRPDDRSNVGVSYANYRDLREASRSFGGGLVADEVILASFGRSRVAPRDMRVGMLVSDNFFDVLGVEPSLGRRFAADEGRARGRDAVVMLGYDFWKNGLAADESILGSVVVLNGVEFTVVGVTPASFTGIDQLLRPAFYVPAAMADLLVPGAAPGRSVLDDRTARTFDVKGRLAPAVSQQAAQAELAILWEELERRYPDANSRRVIEVMSENQVRLRRQPEAGIQVAIMTALAATVLVIACANVANLLLGRGRARARELAIRLALGISRLRLLRQLLTESLLLALVGGLLGLGVAEAGIRFLSYLAQAVVPTDIPVVVEPHLDGRALAFSLLAAAASAVIFGIAPAWQSLKTDVIQALKNQTGDRGKHRTLGRSALVVVQVALSMVLLVVAGILVDGSRRSLSLDPGFRTDHLLIAALDTSMARSTPAQMHDFYRDLVDRARQLPDVVSVTLTSSLPLGALQTQEVIPDGYRLPPGRDTVQSLTAVVDQHYFGTMRIELIGGRAFVADDREGGRPVAIVNEEFGRRFWPGQNPVGKRLRLQGSQSRWLDVVGVAKTTKYGSIFEAPTPFLYLPFAQNERARMSLLLQTAASDPSALAAPVRALVRELDANQPVGWVSPFVSHYRRGIASVLMLMEATGAMGTLGLTLALVGLYGLVAYSVARRTQEIGVRMALGAGRSDVLTMVLRQGVWLAVAGIGLGALASAALARFITAALAGLGPPHPATLAIVPLLLIALTLAASYIPARRASRIDPLRALRCE